MCLINTSLEYFVINIKRKCPLRLSDESAMEQKSSEATEGPDREPSTTDDERTEAESPLVSIVSIDSQSVRFKFFV